ncbi:MAG: exo-alpha-sialidase [Actinobacteria bacterium]|nr:exo-alpha-sialidase [Actinomycetota bacterium]
MRARLVGLLVLAALAGTAVAGAAPVARILGTPRADMLVGREGADTIGAGRGADRIAAEYDNGVDRISCGPGRDIVVADPQDRVERDCEVVSRRISRDRYTNPESQHESEAEPDSFTVGSMTVTTFQVGRMDKGAAANLGFATSSDGGRTWGEGLLPGLTKASVPPGPSDRASDPVVAFSAKHATWLISGLTVENGIATRLTIQRSPNGLTWSAPVEAAVGRSVELAFDKQWLACDNGATSPFRGRCYLAYTDLRAADSVLSLQRSDDGGLTWSAPLTLQIPLVGAIPVVQPDGKLVLSFWSPGSTGSIVAITSTDGGQTFNTPVTISDLRTSEVRPFRAPPLVASEVDQQGGILVTWQDCRFRAACTENDVVLARSADGLTWSAPVRLTSGRNAVMPTIGVEPGTRRLAILYYALYADGADAELITSTDGTRWTAPQRLNARRMSLEWMPQTTLGRMLADYIAVTWSRGRPLAVYAHASPPRKGKLRQAIYATDR